MTDLGILSLAFSSGFAAFLNPCSFALLPAYLSYLMGEENDKDPDLRGLLDGLRGGSMAVTGFATVFLSTGALVSYAGSQIRSFLPPILTVVGAILIILGAAWVLDLPALSLTKYGLNIPLPKTSFYLFGIGYALSSLACVFPVFLMIVFSGLGGGGFTEGFAVFLSFTAGMGIPMMAVTVSLGISKNYLLKKLEEAERYIRKISGIILIAAGTYLIIYWNLL